MNNFKRNLRKELEQDAPFAEEVKQRILNRQPEKKQFSFKVAATLISFAAILLVSIYLATLPEPQVTIEPPTMQQAKHGELTDDFEVLMAQMLQKEVALPLQKKARAGQTLIKDADVRFNGRQMELQRHAVYLEKVDKIELGDYVLVKTEEGLNVVRQVFATKGDQFRTQDGTIYVNDKPLLLPNTIDAKTFKYEPLFLRYNVYYFDKGLPTPTSKGDLNIDEFVVAQNTIVIESTEPFNGLQVETVRTADIVGKVTAIQSVEPTFLLTGKKLKLYKDFKENYDLNLLKGQDAVTMLRMFYMTSFERDFRTAYELMPSTMKLYNLSFADFEEQYKLLVPYTTEELRSIDAFYYSGIEDGKFEVSGTKKVGHVHYKSFYDEQLDITLKMQMVIDGLWEPGYMYFR